MVKVAEAGEAWTNMASRVGEHKHVRKRERERVGALLNCR